MNAIPNIVSAITALNAASESTTEPSTGGPLFLVLSILTILGLFAFSVFLLLTSSSEPSDQE